MGLAGKWNVSMETPIGTQAFVWDLQSQGGAWSGTMTAVNGVTPLTGLEVEGERFSCEADVASPMGSIHVKFSGAVAGDTTSGTCQTMFGDIAFAGSRG